MKSSVKTFASLQPQPWNEIKVLIYGDDIHPLRCCPYNLIRKEIFVFFNDPLECSLFACKMCSIS